MENGGAARTVTDVEVRYSLARETEHFCITVECFRFRIGEIGEKGKGEIAIPVTDVAKFDSV